MNYGLLTVVKQVHVKNNLNTPNYCSKSLNDNTISVVL